MKPNLSNILVADEKNAKSSEFINETLPAGEYMAKLVGFTEEDTYQFFSFEINGKTYNFFYNYYIKDTTDYNLELIVWIKALATIQFNEQTNLLDIVNSAIGSTYKITLYNYTSKTGKNAGKQQHAISFSDVPVVQSVQVNATVDDTEDEDIDLPI